MEFRVSPRVQDAVNHNRASLQSKIDIIWKNFEMHASGRAQEDWETQGPLSDALTGCTHFDEQPIG
jgi:hypothetical protein